ncbi:hypothetical protein ACFXI0_01965 [Kitasatospora indigofera]
MVTPLVAGLSTAVEGAVELERYYSDAAALGVSRGRADELLAEAQGLAAGSSPSSAEIADARHLAFAEAMG